MFYKLLRKTGLGKPALGLSVLFLKNKTVLPSPDSARAQLKSISPDPGNSCIHPQRNKPRGLHDLDIIIPAYNVENYIERCINSVLEQDTKYSFRLIVIDDGSNDNTGKILDTYSNDTRMLIIHQENMGLAGARNTGLDLSDADYIMFLDSDDFLPDGSIEALMNAAIENHAQISEGAFVRCNPDGSVHSRQSHESGWIDVRRGLYGFACMKVLSTALFEQVQFPLGYLFEDSIMSQIIYPLAEKNSYSAYGVSDSVYCYTVNPQGITSGSKSRPKSIDSFWITMQLYKDRQKLGLERDAAYYEYILSMIVLSYRRTYAQSEDVKKAIFVLWKAFLDSEFAGFYTGKDKYKVLQQALREGNYPLYSAACRLI